ncbi:hypothetical protein AB0C15_28840 [Micromonospora sp. NPDC048835]
MTPPRPVIDHRRLRERRAHDIVGNPGVVRTLLSGVRGQRRRRDS